MRWTLLATLPALGLAAWQAAWPWPFFSDDAFVSLRYAERLLQGHGLTWTDGERVEGYSNLLWLLGCALLSALGIDLVTAARVLGALCTAGALWFLAGALRPRDLRTSAAAAVAPILVATSGTVMAWTLGGLEGPMVLLWLAWGFALVARGLGDEPRTGLWTARALLRCSVPFALACWTRPDSPLWVASVGAVLGLSAWRAGVRSVVSRTLLFALLPLLAFAAQTLFRVAYYGDWVPNTAYVKAQFDPGSGAQGLDYVASALWASPGLTWPALLGTLVLLVHRPTRVVALAVALPTALWFVYLAAIGGDHFPGRRLLHGALAPLGLLGGLLCVLVGRRLGAIAAVVATGCVLALAAFGVHASRTDPKFVENKYETWEWRGKVVGEALARAFGPEQPRLAVDSAGAVPFYSRLPALDMLGLCDRTIARTPFRDWLLAVKARGDVPLPPGHLRGNGAYVMDQSPDLILMGPPPGLPLPVFVSALEFEDDPRFFEHYRCVLVDLGANEILPGVVEPIVAPLWTLLHGRAGLRVDADRVEVPAWLFGSLRLPRPLMKKRLPPPPDSEEGRAIAAGLQVVTQWYVARQAVAAPDPTGRLELELRAATAELTVPLAAGTWRAELAPATAQATVKAADCARAADGTSFVVDRARDVVLTLDRAAATAVPLRLQQVVLVRQR